MAWNQPVTTRPKSSRMEPSDCGVSDFARKAFAARGIPLADSVQNGITPILPIPTGGTVETCMAAKKMFDGGVFVNPFVPPGVPEGHALIRTSFMATHTNELVEEAADIIAGALGC